MTPTISSIVFTTDRDKFGNTDDDIMATVDKEASLTKLDQMLMRRLSQSYPGATIFIKRATVSPTRRIDVLDEAGDYVERNSEGTVIEDIEYLIDEVWLEWFDHLVYNV